MDDVSGWSSISTVGIATSSDSPSDDRWGDYGRVAAYDGSSNTWIGSAYTAASSTTQEPRFVWFGRERDGCADLVVSAFGFLYSSSSNLLTLADTTWNTGGIEAAASKTRFYLSRDTAADSGDTLLDAIHEVPALDDADSDPELLFTSVPEGTRAGTYYVIACADQPESIDEVSDSNNCLVEPDTLTVKAKFTLTRPAVTIAGPKKPGAKPGTFTGPRPRPVTTTSPTKTIPTDTTPRPGATTAPGRTPPRPGRTITRPATTTIERPARPPVRQGPSVTTTAQG